MVSLRFVTRHKRVGALALVIAFLVYLGAPNVAFSRAPYISNGGDDYFGMEGHDGDPVGGERRDGRDLDGLIFMEQDSGETGSTYGHVPHHPVRPRDDTRVPGFLRPLSGILGGTTCTFFVYRLLRIPAGGR